MPVASQIPSQVWIGNSNTLKAAIVTYLQQQLCNSNGCQSCIVCTQITQEQSASVHWLQPQGNYKLEQVEPIHQQLSYRLGQHEQFYFIFQDAQYLSAACANSLLKSIEEPPRGYHFIFLTNRKEAVISTILSRSTIVNLTNKSNYSCDHPLYLIFTLQQTPNGATFWQILESQTTLTDQLSYELLENIYQYWLQHYTKDPLFAQPKIELFQKLLLTPPMPGSSKLFWRQVYLQLFS